MAFNLHAAIISNTNVEFSDAWRTGEYLLSAFATDPRDPDWKGTAYFNLDGTKLTHVANQLSHTSIEFKLSSFGNLVGTGIGFTNGSPLERGYGDFYLSVITKELIITLNGRPEVPIKGKGWILLNNSPTTGLTMKSNAMAYSGEQLTVGAVPEPSTLAFSSISGVFI